MFEIGRSYKITSGTGDNVGYSTFIVTDWQFPLLKLEAHGEILIMNTASSEFVCAELHLTNDEKRAGLADFPDLEVD